MLAEQSMWTIHFVIRIYQQYGKTCAFKFQNGGNPKHTLRLIHAQTNVRF